MHRLGVAATRGFAAGLGRPERLHVDIADASIGEARSQHVLGKTGAPRIGHFAHVDQCFHLRGYERRDKNWDTDALVADGPDAAHCR
jgi:hypothetical protein